MKIIITRHGQTDQNQQNITQGQGVDSLLNETGVCQAKKLAERLKTEKIDVIYASDLKRALHTAQEVLRFHPSAQIVPTPHLRERNLGAYEGRSHKEYQELKEKSPLPFHDFKPEGGESYGELYHRVGTFLDTILEKHRNNTVLFVSHGAVSTVLLLKLLGKPLTSENYSAHKPSNAALTMLEISGNKKVTVVALNSTHHLD